MDAAQIDRIDTLLRQLNPEIWLITVATGSRRGGMIATGVMPASIVAEMPRLLVGVNNRHATAELLQEARCFAAHLLWPDQTALVERFGMHSGRTVDKLDGIPHRTGHTGAPVLEDCRGWLECRVEASLNGGDRTFYLTEVLDGRLNARAAAEVEQRSETGSSDAGTAPAQSDIMQLASLLAAASESTLAELRRQRLADAALDAEAIAGWRSDRNS